MIPFKQINVTQASIRNHDQIRGMSIFVQDGGVFDRNALNKYSQKQNKKPSPLVQLNLFEDDSLFLLDGHHRSIGILEGGRTHFEDNEVTILKYTYREFAEIAFLKPSGEWMGWVTPFDPRTHVRLPDIKDFKEKVKDIYYDQSPDHARHLILTRPDLYRQERLAKTVWDIHKLWAEDLALAATMI